MFRWLVLGFFALCGVAHAQGSGPFTQMVPGYSSTTGCNPGVSPCFIPYGSGGSGPGSTVAISQVAPGTTNGVVINSGTIIAAGAVANSNDVAQGSATAGQLGPLIQGAVGTNNPSLTNAQTSPISVDPFGRTRMVLSSNTTGVPQAVQPQVTFDGMSASACCGLPTDDFLLLYNGTTWDRQRANFDAVALVTLTAAGAGTTSSPDQINYNGRCVTVVVDLTIAGGTPTLTVTVQGKDAASGKYYTLLASAALASVATTPLVVCPGTTAATNLDVALPLPRVWRVSAVVGGVTPAVTATIGASVTN